MKYLPRTDRGPSPVNDGENDNWAVGIDPVWRTVWFEEPDHAAD